MKFEFSWILVPLILILYIFFRDTTKYLIPLTLCVSIIGIIEILFYNKKLRLFDKIIQIFFHLIILICLLNFLQVNLNNTINYILLVIFILFILFIPHWPYYMSRKILLTYFIIIYLLSILINIILKYHPNIFYK